MFSVLELLALGRGEGGKGGEGKLQADSRMKYSFYPVALVQGTLQKCGLVQHSCNSAIPLGKVVLSELMEGGVSRLPRGPLSQRPQQRELQLAKDGELAVHTILPGSLSLKKKKS